MRHDHSLRTRLDSFESALALTAAGPVALSLMQIFYGSWAVCSHEQVAKIRRHRKGDTQDSKNAGPMLTFSRRDWRSFVIQLKNL